MFFFSSRRRHTRWPRDWSSDVCSSDLYPLVDEPAVLVWLAQLAALEIHTPQWRFDADDEEMNPDRLVLDLDPGEGAGLPDCAPVALGCCELLEDVGLGVFHVASRSRAN